MGFDAATTSPLDFTFRPHLDLTGTIKDPTEAQVRAFNAAVARIEQDARDALTALLKSEDDEKVKQEHAEEINRNLHEQQLDAVAELCSGEPAREQIAQLPYRVQVGFFDWLSKELRDPTMLPATKPPLAAVR